jgi:hypothetical protein
LAQKIFSLTAGIAAKNFHKDVLNLGLFIVIIALSMMVAFDIIHISHTDRKINDAAIATSNADSEPNLCGTKIPIFLENDELKKL